MANAINVENFANDYIKKAKQFYPLIGTVYTNDNAFINPLDKKNIINVEKFQKEQTELLHTLNPNKNDAITYRILELDLNNSVKYLQQKIPYYLPVNQIFSWHLEFLVIGSGSNDHIFNTLDDYDNWAQKMHNFADFLNSSIDVMRDGINQNITLQKSLVLRMITQFEEIANTKLTDNPFYLAIKLLDNNKHITEKDKIRITNEYTQIISHKLLPIYKKIAFFLKNEYLPHSSQDTGVGQFVGGQDYYNFMIKNQAETDLSADEIHELGLQEVAKIVKEIDIYKTEEQSPYFKTEQEILDYLENISKTVNQNVEKLFNILPKTPLVIKQVEKYRESGASPHYMPGDLTKNRPGIYYMPIIDATKISKQNAALEATFIHESTPGHHYQISLAQENINLSQFRKDFFSTAMCECWALYTESLGKELGLYRDKFEYLGYLEMSMMRAIRLVVDTGLHAKGWTKDDAVTYSKKYLSQPDEEIINSIERYMALPGQALSYKIGYFKIIEILEKQKKLFGDKFDIKIFHDNLLKNGTVPLFILEKNV
jgi:uncharacterized protein (DUF885 family)